MSVDFSLQSVIDIIAQVGFDGNTALAGMAIMLMVFFVGVLIMAAVGAPIGYSLIPMIPTAILFSYLGIIDTTLTFLVIISVAIFSAIYASKVATGSG